MIPLFPQGEIFHSRLSSKFSYSSVVTISPPSGACQSPFGFFLASSIMAPSDTTQLEPIVVLLKLCQPFVVLPSNNNFHPSFCSDEVKVFVLNTRTGISSFAFRDGI